MNVGAVNPNIFPPSSQKVDAASNGALDKDDFLMLLVTQLRYQNPANPMSNEAFIAQSAQFSALEQMKDMNEGMQTLVDLQKTSSRTAALNLLGKHVVVQQSDVSLSSGSPVDLSYSLSADANVAITIFDVNGGPVRIIDVGEQLSGDHALVWDGLNDEGVKLPDGKYTYKVSATDADGNSVDASEIIAGVVDGLVFENEPYISIAGVRFPLAAVTEVASDTPVD